MGTSVDSTSVNQAIAAQRAAQARAAAAATAAARTATTQRATATTSLQRSLQTDRFESTGGGTTTSPRAGETVNSRELAITTQLARRSDLQPRGGVTHCNQFVHAYAQQMLGNTRQVSSLFDGNAHQQYQHLAAAARTPNSGVQEISAAQAGQLAAQGRMVVVTTSEVSRNGHGHIAAVIGSGPNGSVRTGQAGSTNWADGGLSTRFTGAAARHAHYYVVG